SLPWMVTPASSGVVVSSTTSIPRAMVTFPPAAGTAPPAQVAGLDQLPLFAASCASALAERQAEASRESRNQELRITPPLKHMYCFYWVFQFRQENSTVILQKGWKGWPRPPGPASLLEAEPYLLALTLACMADGVIGCSGS